MKKLEVKSSFLAESKKWMPAGTTFEGVPPVCTEVGLKEKFDTQEEADNFIVEIYKKRGFEVCKK